MPRILGFREWILHFPGEFFVFSFFSRFRIFLVCQWMDFLVSFSILILVSIPLSFRALARSPVGLYLWLALSCGWRLEEAHESIPYRVIMRFLAHLHTRRQTLGATEEWRQVCGGGKDVHKEATEEIRPVDLTDDSPPYSHCRFVPAGPDLFDVDLVRTTGSKMLIGGSFAFGWFHARVSK